jgi:cbb3-type cytochrome oxidase maturation protein
MESLYLLIPLSLLLVLVIGATFWWATHSGQFDDFEGAAHRILLDDDRPDTQATQDPPQDRAP